MSVAQRVLIVTPWIGRDGGGVSEVARLETEALVRRRVAVELLSFRSSEATRARADWPDVPIRLFRSFGPASFRFSPGLLWHLLRRPRGGVAHVHGLWMFHGAAVELWARLRGGSYAVTPHGMLTPWILTRSERLKWAVGVLFQRRALRRARAVQALTRAEVDEVVAYAGDSISPRVALIGNFVPPGAQVEAARGKVPGKIVFLFLGRIHDKKGWRELCSAWDKVCAADPDLCARIALDFAGWPDACPDFEPTVSDLAARHGNVRWIGPVFGADKAAALAGADVFVLPSRSEGLPMAVLEAWQTGLPALLTPDCNLPEGIEAGAALECNPDAESIAALMRRFSAMSPDELENMGEAGRRLVAAQYSEGSVMDLVLTELLGLKGETA